jgi:hypothetical protein
MKINWKRVVIAAIWSELVLTVIYIAVRYAISAGLSSDFGISIITLDWFGLMFLGGLWVTRRIESRFVLHGLLVGIVASILYFPLSPLIGLLLPEAVQAASNTSQLWMIWIAILSSCVWKMLGSTLGAYVGGRRRKKLLSAQAGQSPS